MNILLLGAGGREHALAWKLSQSESCARLFIAPGNAGTAQCGTNLPVALTDFEGIRNACRDNAIEMVIVGPEEPLVNGITDFLRADEGLKDLMIIGPSRQAAQLEGSKAFAKAFMQRHGIPTAAYREFTADNFTEGLEYLKAHPLPIVLKADGLAAGKGVIICMNHVEAVAEFELMIQRSKFGEAGRKVVVEEFLQGIELSVFVLTDDRSYVVLPEAKDYKRVGEGDKGLNTGGMGAISPVPFAGRDFLDKVRSKVIEPTIRGLHQENLDYRGFLFLGLMMVGNEPYVIEYNCRLGDPETEVVIPRLQNDLCEVFSAIAQQRLHEIELQVDGRWAATVVAVSGGYPNNYQKGFEVTGIPSPRRDYMVFHMGTKEENGKVVTNGGRVACATALAYTLDEAISSANEVIESVDFENKYYRKDIGFEFIS